MTISENGHTVTVHGSEADIKAEKNAIIEWLRNTSPNHVQVREIKLNMNGERYSTDARNLDGSKLAPTYRLGGSGGRIIEEEGERDRRETYGF